MQEGSGFLGGTLRSRRLYFMQVCRRRAATGYSSSRRLGASIPDVCSFIVPLSLGRNPSAYLYPYQAPGYRLDGWNDFCLCLDPRHVPVSRSCDGRELLAKELGHRAVTGLERDRETIL